MKANTPASRKQKGTRLEKEIAHRINQVLGEYGVKAQRMPLSGAMEGFKSDIYVPSLPISIEAKNAETWKVPEWWEQASSQAGLGKMPILVMSKNYCQDPLAVIRFEDLLTFMAYALESGWVSYIRKGRTTIR
jgi:hypothetical protein